MKVQFLKEYVSPKHFFKVGAVVDLDAKFAARLVKQGYAKAVVAPAPAPAKN